MRKFQWGHDEQGPEARKTGMGLHVVGEGVTSVQRQAGEGAGSGELLPRRGGPNGGPRHMWTSYLPP